MSPNLPICASSFDKESKLPISDRMRKVFEAARTALRERAEKLSLSGRITARALTQARMGTKDSKSSETPADSRLSRP